MVTYEGWYWFNSKKMRFQREYYEPLFVEMKICLSLQSFSMNENGMNRENQYEVTIVFTPVMSEGEVKESIKGYTDFLKEQGCKILNEEHWGLKQMAYPIKKKTTGIYHILDFKADTQLIDKLELSFRRDESILRFLSVRLDKYAAKYNDDRMKGLVGRNKKTDKKAEA